MQKQAAMYSDAFVWATLSPVRIMLWQDVMYCDAFVWVTLRPVRIVLWQAAIYSDAFVWATLRPVRIMLWLFLLRECLGGPGSYSEKVGQLKKQKVAIIS